MTHLKVLLKKDFLTLWRNKGFLFAFVFLPIGFMIAFAEIQSLVDNGQNDGTQLLEDNFFYSSNLYIPYQVPGKDENISIALPFMGVNPFTLDDNNQPNATYTSDISRCYGQNSAKYYFSQIAVVADESVDQDVTDKLKTYFEDYVFPTLLMDVTDGDLKAFTVNVTTNETLNDAVRNEDDQPFCFAIYLNKFDLSTYEFEIGYSFNKNDLPDTNLDAYNELLLAPDLNSWGLWQTSGAPQVYTFMTDFIARMATDASFEKPLIMLPAFANEIGYGPLQSLPYMDISPIGIQQLSQNFPFFFMFIYLIPFYYLVSKIAAERESKAREGMKMMGLGDSSYFLSWLILFFVICLITSAFVSLISGLVIFKNVNMFLFFGFCMLYSMTLYGWSFCIVAFFGTQRTSSICATLFHIISYFLTAILQDPKTSSGLQYGMSILPNVCMNQMVKQIFFYNYQTAEGLTFETGSMEYEGYSFRGGLLFMLGNVIFWGVLGIYLDQVIPSKFGIAKPWNFCCKSNKRTSLVNEQERQALISADDVGDKDQRNFEPVAESLKKQEQDDQCLKVRGLVKKFGPKTAVDGVNLTMYNGQIFALLGHNGAGKTTTISMLTGLIEANAGCAEVFGIDIFNDMDSMRSILGVCPQHDVLFEFLTPEDHLRLFAAFKGTHADLIEDQVKHMLQEIDLYEERGQLSKTLSGGQKRKLSVAIAMIGNSKIVLLDEPTSGMDLSARRRLWEMLKKNKQGRIVILTTHYMDEADILGDRIAIMAEGDVQCTGSSLFLKNRYGVGYNLVIAKKTRDPAPQIDDFITKYITDAKKMQEVSSEISYQLPTSSASKFKDFFALFDQNLDQLGIRSYGVGITTLEEVFLRIGHGDDVEQARLEKKEQDRKEDQANAELTAMDQELEDYSIAEDSESSFFDHMFSILRKKILVQIRDAKTLGIDTLFPCVLIIVGLALSTIKVLQDGQARTMSPNIYPQPTSGYSNDNSKFLESSDIKDFMTNYMYKDTSFNTYSQFAPRKIDNPQNTLDDVKQLDDYIFDQVQNQGADITWGSLYLNNATELDTQYGVKVWSYGSVMLLNSTSQSAPGAWTAAVHSAILQDYLFNRKAIDNPGTFNLTFVNHPLPLSKQYSAVSSTAQGTLSGILITFAWMMVSDSLIQNVIKERQRNVKHQIMVSGCSLGAYWMGNYIADILFQSIPSVCGIIFIKVFDIDVPYVWVLFILNVFTNPAFIYFFSFLFDKDDTGSLVIKMIYIVIGIIGPITMSILQVVNESTQKVEKIMRWFLYVFPQFSLTFGYMSIANRELIQFVNKDKEAYKIFSAQVAGPALYFLIGSIPFYWMLTVGFERKWFDRAAYKNCCSRRGNLGRSEILRSFTTGMINVNNVDEDITEEENRVKAKEPSDLKVRVNNFRKTYGNVVAVDNISFGLEYGECFALLGVSGAGKTTLFKSMTGEIYPTTGEVHICGYDITTTSGFQGARKQIGYCPQFDAIFEGLTVLEHLQIYASLKGVKNSLRNRMIEKAIKEMDLQDYRNIQVNNLSGGNKRKTSVAVALLGNPPLVFLDEPSTGVDPQAKRFMWDIVSKISTQRKKSAVIITTHSMEEAEALCTKMGIMVAGEFKCFGSSQHIKDKYGTGYEIELKIKTLNEEYLNQQLQYGSLSNQNLDSQSPIGMEMCKKILQSQNNFDMVDDIKEDGIGSEFYNLFKDGKTTTAGEFFRWQFTEKCGNDAMDYLSQKFEQFKIVEHYGSNWKLKVSRDSYSIGFLFGMMEDIQQTYEISEYSVTQTTLEQIFNNFAIEAEQKAGKKGRTSTRRRKSSVQRKMKDQIQTSGETPSGQTSP